MGPSQPTNAFVCEVCGARVATLRRGRCWICYVRWADARPVGNGAKCQICAEPRRDNLRMVEFQGRWVTFCHNCSGKIQRMAPLPRTLDGVRQRLTRDRRWSERRGGRKDQRIFATNRRQGERREMTDCAIEPDWLDAEDLIIEVLDIDEPQEATRIAKPAERKSL